MENLYNGIGMDITVRLPQDWSFIVHVVLHFKICEEHNSRVRCQEDENMPGTMKIGEAHTGPPGAEHTVIDPASDCQHPQGDAPTTKADHTQVVFILQLQHQEAHGGNTQGQQDESIRNLKKQF